jgi:adenine-specific DNA-methyltransferase
MKKPVSSIQHKEDKRASIPSTEREGMEAPATEGMNKQSAYQVFAHEFTRGRDPELYWVDKYKNDDEDTQASYLKTDVRSLYVHEDVSPEYLISQLYEMKKEKGPVQQDLFATPENIDDLMERVATYYQHNDDWQNRLILGDSLMVMNSLLNRESMKGKVQCVYFDPPYGIRYGGNWQIMINKPKMSHDSRDQELTIEPEMIKAYRDTWELGIHSYLSYLRDRLVMARELLAESGSCFVQISDSNVHLIRSLMDGVFGSENFVSQIIYQKTTGAGSPAELLAPASVADYIIWYAKDMSQIKYRKLLTAKTLGGEGTAAYNRIELPTGERMSIAEWEKINQKEFDYNALPKGCKLYTLSDLTSQSGGDIGRFPIEFEGKTYQIKNGNVWKTNEDGIKRLIDLKRIEATSNGTLRYVRFYDDFPAQILTNMWTDVSSNLGTDKIYVVQSALKPIQRCILMTTDPGDLVLDPTCGSGTTAYVAEQWGRRWITIDTSRIALNIAKRRLMTAVLPYYVLHDEEGGNIRQGFKYKTVPHITLKALANDLPFDEEILYDQPEEDKKRIRVSGPFTVETLQSLDVTAPKDVDDRKDTEEDDSLFIRRVFDHLQSGGIKNGAKEQKAVMHGMETVVNPYLNARGYYTDDEGRERLVYFLIGPKYGTVSKQQVNKATQEMIARQSEGASWLVILGFSFEDNIENQTISFAGFQVSKVRMGDDLLQDGLLKKDKKAASFIIIGEPDIALVKDESNKCHIEIRGLDMYDPIKNMVKERSVADIAYWEMDTDYSGNRFRVKSIHFCGGGKDEFDPWKKGLTSLQPRSTKKGIEQTLRMEFCDEVWDRLYDFRSEPMDYVEGRKVAVRVVSQFGEESTKVITM